MAPENNVYKSNTWVHYVKETNIWASRGNQIYFSPDNGATWEYRTTLRYRGVKSLLSISRPLRRLLRLGVRSYIQINEKSFIAFCGGESVYWDQSFSAVRPMGRVRYGHGPLLQGCGKDASGTCYYGEYWGNKTRREVNIHCWRPEWEGWRPFYRFPAGSVRHIHAVQFDPFSGSLWVATGDRDDENIIGYFTGPLENPTLFPVAWGSQSARAVSLIFTPDFVYWGSDAGRDTSESGNWIYRWSRRTTQIEQIAPIGGPAYYSTMDDKGRLFISTAVEGSPSEPDNLARVWMSEDGLNWRSIADWKKDSYPLIFGYGVLSFPEGGARNDQLLVTGQGVEGSPGTWVLKV